MNILTKMFLCLFIVIIGCKNETKKISPELAHVLAISDCDSLLNDQIFKENSQMKWPDHKPKSVVEAVLKLDSMTNEFNEHCFKICDPMEFYFGFAMGIRNEWVHQGTDELRTQLYDELKVSHPDFTSGIIMYLFTEYISEGDVVIVDSLGIGMKHDTMKNALQEYVNIEETLNKLKKRRQ